MTSVYEQYDGMLLTFPETASEEEFASYKSAGIRPELQQYTQEIFDELVSQAQKYIFSEIKYVDGCRNDGGYGGPQGLTPENMVIYRNKLYAVKYYQLCAVGSATYIVPLADMVEEPCLVNSRTDRFDDYGDHDSWTVDTYIKMEVEE